MLRIVEFEKICWFLTDATEPDEVVKKNWIGMMNIAFRKAKYDKIFDYFNKYGGILKYLVEEDSSFITEILLYTFDKSTLPEEEFMEKFTKVISSKDIPYNPKSVAGQLFSKGMLEGMEKGKLEGMEEVALNMYQKGIAIDTIAACTNLSLEQINKIVSSKQN